jgi:aryl-phospho-beta-D-glucosidase BglC (GH1 family)
MRFGTWRLFLCSFFCLLLTRQGATQGFLKAAGQNIIDAGGKPIILRGMGLGGWMLQEPYMLQLSGAAVNQTDIKAKITDIIGVENTATFYNAWLNNHCTKADIDSMKAWGFNSVRLPMHYNLYTLPLEQEPVPGKQTWLTKGFEMTDSLLSWCKANELYLILDLHAAPGGQGADNAISDRDSTKPSLW